eukprot:14736409-Alexandrium_andersonii.AAC.1
MGGPRRVGGRLGRDGPRGLRACLMRSADGPRGKGLARKSLGGERALRRDAGFVAARRSNRPAVGGRAL